MNNKISNFCEYVIQFLEKKVKEKRQTNNEKELLEKYEELLFKKFQELEELIEEVDEKR